MGTILLFNDDSDEAINAGEFAVSIANKVRADLLILNLCKKLSRLDVNSFQKENTSQAKANQTSKIKIQHIDASAFTEKDICKLVIEKHIWLMVKGIEKKVTHDILTGFDVQSVLNHVACPLLLIPDGYKKRSFENITYAVDLRYCRAAVLKFLTDLSVMYNANLMVEHFSAKGLPHLSDSFARDLFEGEIMKKIKHEKVYFNNFKERNLDIAVDVMINDLHADLLALVNHRYHFSELFGSAIKNVLPEHIAVPVIVFPM